MPSWTYTVDLSAVFHNDEMTFEQRRDAVVRTIRASRWYKTREVNDLFHFVDELADTTDVNEFDSVWAAIYDEANADRAWIKTRS